jgi:hypothetical protein
MLCPALSISGGEPTISAQFIDILKAIKQAQREWDRVVLTTNGSDLTKWLAYSVTQEIITHINISRHHFDDAHNNIIFKNKDVPDTQQIRAMVKTFGHKYQFNINCVINDKTDENFIYRMLIHTAHDLGIDSIAFRKEAGDVSPTNVEKTFVKKFGIVSSNDCPVCRTVVQTSKGMRIMWKGSHPQPSQFLNKLYELVFHPDGIIYADWDRKIGVDLNMQPTTPEAQFWFNQWTALLQAKSSHEEKTPNNMHNLFVDGPFIGSHCGGGGGSHCGG